MSSKYGTLYNCAICKSKISGKYFFMGSSDLDFTHTRQYLFCSKCFNKLAGQQIIQLIETKGF